MKDSAKLENWKEKSISLWVSNGSVFVSYAGIERVQKRIESEASVMELEVDIPPTIVLSSNGPASEKAGSYLGQFEFDKTKNC